MIYDILKTGSSGNCTIINKEIAIDIGVPMNMIMGSGYINTLKLVLLTHLHSDHFKKSTANRLHKIRPGLRFVCCSWMVQPLQDAGVGKNVIDVCALGLCFLYRNFIKIKPERIPHNVDNCCWHIWYGNDSLFYATDCSSLSMIKAENYRTYMIEANHSRAEIEARIAAKHAAGEFAYEEAAMRNHLSEEQALEWLAENMGPESRYAFLHQHVDEKKKREATA